MELLDKGIHIHDRHTLRLSDVKAWPAPRRHQYCLVDCWTNSTNLSEFLSALHVVRQRSDINGLQISLRDLLNSTVWDVLKEILSIKDRSWSIVLFCQVVAGQPSWEDIPFRKRALSILEYVHYLSLVKDPKCNIYQDVLEGLPEFHCLKCLDFQGWAMHPQDVEVLYSQYASLAPRVRGIVLQTSNSQKLPHPIFSKDTAARIHTLDLWFLNFSVQEVSILVSTVMALPSLRTLRVVLPDDSERHMEQALSLLEWLASPLCPVMDLTFRHHRSHVLPLLLMDLSNIPNLKTLQLDVKDVLGLDMDLFFDALLESPLVESILLQVFHLDEATCHRIFRFLVESRPRLFTVKLTSAFQLKGGTAAKNIRHVSLVHQTLQNFNRSRKKDESEVIPLPAWPIVLEKLGIAFESSSTEVHNVGFDARFRVLRDLLDMTHSLVVDR